jgi:hypothetical protein
MAHAMCGWASCQSAGECSRKVCDELPKARAALTAYLSAAPPPPETGDTVRVKRELLRRHFQEIENFEWDENHKVATQTIAELRAILGEPQ